MSTVAMRPATIVHLSSSDRKALRELTTSLFEQGGITDAAVATFARELSDVGLQRLLTAHYADVTQTAIDSLGMLTKRKVIAAIDGNTDEAREKRASILATVEQFQNQLRASRQ